MIGNESIVNSNSYKSQLQIIFIVHHASPNTANMTH